MFSQGCTRYLEDSDIPNGVGIWWEAYQKKIPLIGGSLKIPLNHWLFMNFMSHLWAAVLVAAYPTSKTQCLNQQPEWSVPRMGNWLKLEKWSQHYLQQTIAHPRKGLHCIGWPDLCCIPTNKTPAWSIVKKINVWYLSFQCHPYNPYNPRLCLLLGQW